MRYTALIVMPAATQAGCKCLKGRSGKETQPQPTKAAREMGW